MRLLALTFLISLSGCIGDLVDINQPTGDGGGAQAPAPDMAPGGGNDTGGGMPRFFPGIQKDLETKGCTLAACHGATAPVLKPMPAGADQQANYDAFVQRAKAGEASLVLTEGLPGAMHGGAAYFTGTTDPMYVKWLGWINAGNPSGL